MKEDILKRAKKRKIRALIEQGRLAEAKAACLEALQARRLDAEALVLLSTVCRALGDYEQAESHARRAVQLAPELAEAHHALATVLHARGQAQEAVNRYQVAIRLNPGFLDAHYCLGNLLRENGLLGEAIACYRSALQINPDHVPTLCNLGGSLAGIHQLEEAALHLNKANRLRPGSAPILCNVARVLQLLGRPAEAEQRCREALAEDPNAVDAISMLADLAEKSSHLGEVRALVERGLALAPNHAGLRLNAARLARREGRYQEAIALANEALRAAVSADVRADAHYLLGQLYDRLDETVEAFAHLSEANRITAAKCAGPGVIDQSYLAVVERHRQELRAATPVSQETTSAELETDFPSPIFLVGFPRSGTTLLEQILDSHPRLQALDERPTVSVMTKAYEQIVGRRPAAASALSAADIRELRAAYYAEAKRHLPLDPNRMLVDKNPLNLVQGYFIWRVFPQAKFILAIRHPCDVCFSCFMQNFSLNQALRTFTSLEETAATYAGVMSLWQEYTSILPLRHHMIRYEDLVDNVEPEARRLLAFLHLDWDDAVLQHVEHARHRGIIRTPSYHQVTQPIYRHARYRWKRYVRELEPVMGTLRPFIELFGYGEPA